LAIPGRRRIPGDGGLERLAQPGRRKQAGAASLQPVLPDTFGYADEVVLPIALRPEPPAVWPRPPPASTIWCARTPHPL
jgi:hypothetical protein